MSFIASGSNAPINVKPPQGGGRARGEITPFEKNYGQMPQCGVRKLGQMF